MTDTLPSLDGRRFGSVSNSADGEVDDSTVFDYHQDGDLVTARYAGGQVREGYLVGTRDGGELELRYVHLNVDGHTASGRCHSQLELLEDGRLRLHETWAWESMDGAGTSVVEQLP